MYRHIMLLTTFTVLALNASMAGEMGIPQSKFVSGDRMHLRHAHKKGQVSLHVGAGFVSLQLPTGFDYVQFGEVERVYPNVMSSAMINYALTDNISVGILFDTFKSTIKVQDVTDPNNADGFDYSSTTIALRGSYHIYSGRNLIWLDPYATGMLGYQNLKDTPVSTDNGILEPEKGGLAYGLYFGANFYFFQPIGLFVETGFGINLLNAGVTLRF